MPAVDLTAEEVSSAAAVLVVTDHSSVDYGLVVEKAQLVLDTRNALKGHNDSKVVHL